MMRPGKIALLSLAGLILLIGLAWGGTALGLLHYKVFQPRKENIRREVFENTQSYVEAKRQAALKYRLEYMRTADTLERKALRMIIVQEFANFDEEKLSPELRDFIHQMKYEE